MSSRGSHDNDDDNDDDNNNNNNNNNSSTTRIAPVPPAHGGQDDMIDCIIAFDLSLHAHRQRRCIPPP